MQYTISSVNFAEICFMNLATETYFIKLFINWHSKNVLKCRDLISSCILSFDTSSIPSIHVHIFLKSPLFGFVKLC
jgi:hypothetical protein